MGKKKYRAWVVKDAERSPHPYGIPTRFVAAAVASLLSLFPAAVFGSQALTNLVDDKAAWDCFASYTNNTLRVEAVSASEWDPASRLDRLPFDMPFQLVTGPTAADRAAAEAALATVTTSMPAHIRAYYAKHRLLAPLQQWLIRRNRPGITNEALYVSAAAHPNVWRAADFDLSRLSAAAQGLTSNSVPMMANLCSLYEGYKCQSIERATPLVDYPDPRPEETYATPFGTAVVLRAPEGRRKFRFMALGWPFRDRNVNFKWVSKGGVWLNHLQGLRERYPLERGNGEIVLDWGTGGNRRDVLVFARYGNAPWGPPSVISFFRVPNERRQYDRQGTLQSIEYVATKCVIPQLYQNKPWKDAFAKDALGQVFGFQRTRAGQFRDELFSMNGERVLETYAGDIPKVTAKVRYFTRENDPTTLDYEVTSEKVNHSQKPFVGRNRGEFPFARKK